MTSVLFAKWKESTIIHLFYGCPEVAMLWQELLKYVQNRFQFDLQKVCLSVDNVIKNTIVEPAGHVINFLCLLTKQYVYRQRCLKEAIHFPVLKEIIYQVENIEKYVAIKNNRLRKHRRKWLQFPIYHELLYSFNYTNKTIVLFSHNSHCTDIHILRSLTVILS